MIKRSHVFLLFISAVNLDTNVEVCLNEVKASSGHWWSSRFGHVHAALITLLLFTFNATLVLFGCCFSTVIKIQYEVEVLDLRSFFFELFVGSLRSILNLSQ